MSGNTWPGGHRHAMTQADHEAWNAKNYPGTRQICDRCDEPTEMCEEDAFWSEDGQECLCRKCWEIERDTETGCDG